MNSFLLRAVGHLTRNPETVTNGTTTHTRFCLVGHDYAGKDDDAATREIVTALWFKAFGPIGKTIARYSRKGDQLVVDASIRHKSWTDMQGDKHSDYEFVVQGFRFCTPAKETRKQSRTHPSPADPLPKTPE
jgi:single-stranded DNA-binding protein